MKEKYLKYLINLMWTVKNIFYKTVDFQIQSIFNTTYPNFTFTLISSRNTKSLPLISM